MAMASLPLCRWSTKVATDTTVEISTVPLNSSIFISGNARRCRLPAPAAKHNSSSCSTSGFGSRPKKRINSDSHSSEETKNFDKAKSDVVLVPASNGGRDQRRPNLSFESLFGRKSLWRRILFASKKVRSIILLNVITVVYASDIPVLKEVEAIVDPAAFSVVRFAVSAIPFIPFMWQARDDVYTRNSGIELGFWVSVGYLMQALGLLTSDAGRTSFISMFTVIVVPLLDGILGAVVPYNIWFGAVISVIGVAMLESSGSPPSVGDLLNFLSAVFFGVHMLRTEHISRSTNKKNFLPLLGYEVCVIALFSMTWYFVGGWFGGTQGSDPSSWTWTMFLDWMVSFPWIPALYTGVFSTGFCLWIEIAAMRDVSATETAIIYGLEPVWGAGFAWFLLGERWGATGWLGAALVLGGSLTAQLFESSSPCNSGEEEETNKKGDPVVGMDKKDHFTTSPVVISSDEDVPNLFKKGTQKWRRALKLWREGS